LNWIEWVKAPFQSLTDTQDDLSAIRHIVAELPRRFALLEEKIMATKDEVLSRLDTATNEVANDLSDLRSRLEQAVADKDQAVRDAVNDVLSGFDAPISRLEQLGQDPSNPVPDPEPTPAEPTDPNAPVDVTNPTPVDEDGTPVDSEGNPI
jgi:molybdopterin converting factor small subunit